jgi:outer membrane lipoprotein-sorting protein
MKRPIILCLCSIVLGFSAIAQPPKSMGQSDPDAKKVLDAVSAKFKTFKTVKANFNYRIESSGGKEQGAKKGIVYMKGTKYRVTITGQEIYCDGNKIWTFDKSANEVQVSQFDPATNTITPQKLFTNFYDKDFLYKLNDEKKQGSKVLQQVELTPVDKTKPYFKVLLDVDKKSKIIMSTTVFEKNGNRYIYSINNISTNTSIPDDTFVFDETKYPGVEVIDLR